MSEISIRGVMKSYGRNTVIHGVDLTIAAGAFAVILGPSGCGKSTLLRMIAGLEKISKGDIAIDGKVVNKLEPRERGCAMVFQNYALYPHMTVADNIGYALKVAGVSKDERAKRVNEVAKSLALTDFLARKPSELSGGQRQRVAMGRAMIRQPKVFLYDEPLSNLDAKLRVQMRAEIRKLHNQLGATSVFVTHDQVEAMTLADQIIVMNAGRVEQVGMPSEVYRKPATRFVASFIGAPPMNLLEAKVTGRTEVAIGSRHLMTPHHGLANGQSLIVGVRPEDVSSNSGETLNVSFVEELGAQRFVHGTFEGQDFVVQQPPSDSSDKPATVVFSIRPETIHLFDAATGLRIEPASVTAPAPAFA